jgi:hypothetical protein
MIPDYPKYKHKALELINKRLRNTRNQYLSPFANAFQIPEGNRFILINERGEESEMNFKKSEAKFTIEMDQISSTSPADIIAKIDTAAQSMAYQQFQDSVESIQSAAEKVGNVVDVKGQGLKPEHILESLNKVWMDFDEFDRPIFPTVLINPQDQEKYQKIYKELFENPEYKSRLDEMIEKKRREWNDRESDRKLVG